MTRQIGVVTGTRAEYGLLKPVMEAIVEHDSLDLRLFVTGMHLSSRHGTTLTEIRSDGFSVDQTVTMLMAGDSGISMAKSVGIGIQGFAEAFQTAPDMVVVLGDRGEPLSAAIAAIHMNIPIAHIHGGDVTEGGMVDDSIRHALTKFSHLHFPVTNEARDRILKLGEEKWRITTISAPGLDAIKSGDYMDPEIIRERYGLDPEESLFLVLLHPITSRPEEAGVQMEETLNAVGSFLGEKVVVYPNSDAGSDRIIEVIKKHADRPDIETHKNLPHEEFLGLIGAADVMVGNSSSAIVEAPSIGTPAVDIGDRQAGRQRAKNIIGVAQNPNAIRTGIEQALDPDFQSRAESCDNPYDHGDAGSKVAEILATTELNHRLIKKKLEY